MRNFENAFSVSQMESMADTRRMETFCTLDAETETIRKRGQNVQNVWKPTTCLNMANMRAAAMSESTKPTNVTGKPAYATRLKAFLNPVPQEVFQKSISVPIPMPT